MITAQTLCKFVWRSAIRAQGVSAIRTGIGPNATARKAIYEKTRSSVVSELFDANDHELGRTHSCEAEHGIHDAYIDVVPAQLEPTCRDRLALFGSCP